jgi:serine/threonine-protein kinase RsbT
MTTVREAIAVSLALHVPPRAIQSIVSTLPAEAARDVGQLDLVSSRELLMRIEAGARLFGAKDPAGALRDTQAAINGGRPASMSVERVHVRSDGDVLTVQRQCQRMLKNFFGGTDCIRLTTAASELARNIYMYAREGDIQLSVGEEDGQVVFRIVATDKGPGIRNLPTVLSGGYTSKTGLGKGLMGVHTLLEDVTIETGEGKGTTVRAAKRARRR